MSDPSGKWIRRSFSDAAVVFVHGFLSGEDAWRSSEAFWPDLLMDEVDLHDIGIYTFSYRTDALSSSYSISDAADALNTYLDLDELWNLRNLVFVCHSMGGLVVRRLLVSRQAALIANDLRTGLFLVASPSLGSDYGSLLDLAAKTLKHSQAQALRFSESNAWLNDLDRDFLNLKESQRLKIFGKEVVEDERIALSALFRGPIVSQFSGARYFGDAIKIPGSNHLSVANPTSRDALQHRILVKFISDFLKTKTSRSVSEQSVEDGPPRPGLESSGLISGGQTNGSETQRARALDPSYITMALEMWREETINFVDGGARERVGDFKVDSVQAYVGRLVSSKGSALTFLLGEFGVGKSMHARQLAISLGEKRLINDQAPIPILVPLSRYHSHRNPDGLYFDQFVINYLRDIFGVDTMSWRDLVSLLRQGLICFILDGLDEIPLSGRDDVEIELNHILEVIGRDSSVVITSRPAALQLTLIDSERLIRDLARRLGIDRLNILEIGLFSDHQARSFLQATGFSNILRKLGSGPIRDTFRRPIVLYLLAISRIAREIDVESVTESEILDLTITELLRRRRSQLQTRIAFGEWRHLLEEYALTLLHAGLLEMAGRELVQRLHAVLEHATGQPNDDVAFDLEVRTILSISDRGVHFGHAVFRDCLAAFAIARRMLNPTENDAKLNNLEVEHHLRDYIQHAVRVLFNSPTARPTLGNDRPERIVKSFTGLDSNWCWIARGLGITSNQSTRSRAPFKLTYFAGGFWVGASPVTVGEYLEISKALRQDPLKRQAALGRLNPRAPLTRISQEEAEIVARLFYHGRLPTEEEWERAATWIDGSFPRPEQIGPADPARREPPNVRGGRPNTWGLFDATGCVWQWTQTRDVQSNRPICKGAWWGARAEELISGVPRLDPITLHREHARTGLRVLIPR